MPLPPGETDPNKLYIAVGRAIHAWESMEETFARLYAFMKGLPETPDALPEYGTENNRFGKRADALQEAADAYFVRCPNQDREAKLSQLIKDARELSIKRHRIAHGHVTQWGEFKLPEKRGYSEVKVAMLYRWGAPWYSMNTLRTNPVGEDAASIDATHNEFQTLHNRVAEFISEIRQA